LPASSSTVAVYLSYSIQRQSSVAVINASYYSIQWIHHINLCNNPCSDSLVTLILEGGKRLLSKPVVKKKPITPEILGQIVDRIPHVDNLNNSRLVCMLLIGYAGFFRCMILIFMNLVHTSKLELRKVKPIFLDKATL
jgi:hypothetical protein